MSLLLHFMLRRSAFTFSSITYSHTSLIFFSSTQPMGSTIRNAATVRTTGWTNFCDGLAFICCYRYSSAGQIARARTEIFLMIERAIVLTCLALTLDAWRNESNITSNEGICAATFDFGRSVFWQCRPNRRKPEAGRLAGFANC